MNRSHRRTAVLGLVLTLVAGIGFAAAPAAATPAIGGYCPIAYFKMGKAVKGDAQYTATQDGQTYWFSAAQARDMYAAEPGKFPIAYQGWCATGVAMGKKIAADPEQFTVHGGRLYLFSNAQAKQAFDKDPKMLAAKADAAWPGLR